MSDGRPCGDVPGPAIALAVGQHAGCRDALFPPPLANVLIGGPVGSGTSHLARRLVEDRRARGEHVLVVDLAGDHVGLGRLSDVVVIDGAHPTEYALAALYRRAHVVVLDLRAADPAAVRDHLAGLTARVARVRKAARMPLRVVIDEAHRLLGTGGAMEGSFHRGDVGYTFVTTQPDLLAAARLPRIDVVLTTLGRAAEGGWEDPLVGRPGEPARPFRLIDRPAATQVGEGPVGPVAAEARGAPAGRLGSHHLPEDGTDGKGPG